MIFVYIWAVTATILLLLVIRNRRIYRKINRILEQLIEGRKMDEIPFNESELSLFSHQIKMISHILDLEIEKADLEKEQIKQLISNISHQLKTPLANVMIYEELLGSNDLTKEQQSSDLSEYLLEGTVSYNKMIENNQVILKTLMDGAGYYDGIDIHVGDHITLKVPKSPFADHAELLKFQASDENYMEKDFVVSAIVSRCTGETDEFIGSGTNVVSVIMPQQMMESNFDIADYNSLNINLEENANSDEVSNKLKNYMVGLNKCVIHDNTTEIAKKNDSIMQKVYFFYGIALILFLSVYCIQQTV